MDQDMYPQVPRVPSSDAWGGGLGLGVELDHE